MLPSKSNYYADAEPSNVNPGPQDQSTENEGEESGDSQTAEIPKTVLGGNDFKPGEEVMLEVVRVMENSILVKYATSKGDEEQAPPPAEESEPQANPMSAMMQ